MDTLVEVQQLIAANLDVPAERINVQSKASDFSEWDSLRHLILVMELEQKFKCKFSAEEIAALDSVQKIVEAIRRQVAE